MANGPVTQRTALGRDPVPTDSPIGVTGPTLSESRARGRDRNRRPMLLAAAGLLLLVVATAAWVVPSVAARTSPTGSPALASAPFSAGSLAQADPAQGPTSNAWPTFLGSPLRASYSPSPGIANGTTGWIDCPTLTEIQVGPVANQTNLWVGTVFGILFDLSLTNGGSVVWEKNLSTLPTELDLAGSTLLLGDTSGNVYAVSAANGSLLWSRNIGGAVAQAPLDLNGTAYFGTSAGHLVALNVSSGAVVWSVPVGGPVLGAPAESANTIYVATDNGVLSALSISGLVEWSRSVGAAVFTAPSVGPSSIVLGTGNGTVLAVATSGSHAIVWNFTIPAANVSLRPILATPAQGDGLVVVQPENGVVYALSASNGSLLWSVGLPEFGVVSVTSPAVSPGVVYALDDGDGLVEGLGATNGSVLWVVPISYGGIFTTSPALVGGDLYLGTSIGCVAQVRASVVVPIWPVAGTVTNENGTPLAGVVVAAGSVNTKTLGNGTFVLNLPNGTVDLVASLFGYATLVKPIVVAGPTSGILLVLHPEAVYVVSGVVVNGFTGATLAGMVVTANNSLSAVAMDQTSATGTFSLRLVNGSYSLSVSPTTLYGSAEAVVSVAGSNVSGVRLAPIPAGASYPSLDPYHLVVWLPLGVVGAGVLGVYAHELRRRRLASGLSGRILSPFGRYVLMRGLLVPAQVSLLIAVIYAFDYILGSPSGTVTFASVLQGYGIIWVQLFTGQWGTYTFDGTVTAPTSQFFLWWLGPTLSLVAVALVLSIVISYPLGLLTGASRSTAADAGVRVGSSVVLLVPTFLAALLLFLVFAQTFYNGLGDLPFALLPTFAWFSIHNGGYPPWIGPAINTSPTTIPVIDAAIHGPPVLFALAASKLLLQAFVIALIFSAIYLRYIRAIVVDAGQEAHLQGARSRGVSESSIVWKHLGRRALPFFALVFASTLPIFIGVEAVVEYVFQDQGIGTLILTGLTSLAVPPGQPIAEPFGSISLFQVSLFLVIIAVLFAALAADVLARYLDPRLLRSER